MAASGLFKSCEAMARKSSRARDRAAGLEREAGVVDGQTGAAGDAPRQRQVGGGEGRAPHAREDQEPDLAVAGPERRDGDRRAGDVEHGALGGSGERGRIDRLDGGRRGGAGGEGELPARVGEVDERAARQPLAPAADRLGDHQIGERGERVLDGHGGAEPRARLGAEGDLLLATLALGLVMEDEDDEAEPAVVVVDRRRADDRPALLVENAATAEPDHRLARLVGREHSLGGHLRGGQ